MKSQTMTHAGNHSISTLCFCIFLRNLNTFVNEGRLRSPHLPHNEETLTGYILTLSWDCHFLLPLACSSHGRVIQESRWRRTNTKTGKNEKYVLQVLLSCAELECTLPMTEVWKTHHLQLGRGPSQTWVVTDKTSPNKRFCMMRSLSDVKCWMGPRQWPNCHFPVER